MNARIIFFAILSANFYSQTVSAKSDVKFHGSLYEISCVVNNDNPIDVAFGNVGVNKIDGIQYTQPVPVDITCDGSYSGEFSLYVKGTAADFDDSAVQTDVPDLSIRIMQDGSRIQINKPIIVSSAHPPALTAVPINRPGSSLSEGVFKATATLVVEIV
ncbi:MAG TPA: fimbrial protein [Buttiauxella sp.]|jgi:type 1 fimbria pilin